MGKHFSQAELTAEWTRAAFCVGVYGNHRFGHETETMHRFLTHEGVGE